MTKPPRPRSRAPYASGEPRGEPPHRRRARAGSSLTTREVGASREDRAVAVLVAHGLTVVERNFRTRLGELDVVARDGDTLVFVEVRSRQTCRFGSALEAVGWRKRWKVSRVAEQYLQWRRPAFAQARFDVVAITGDDVVHVRDAWRLTQGEVLRPLRGL